MIRNSDGSPWNWKRALVGAVALFVSALLLYHGRFGYLTAGVVVACCFFVGILLWFVAWVYSKRRVPSQPDR
jgi:O-antigen/teichoic acid export membrane protein